MRWVLATVFYLLLSMSNTAVAQDSDTCDQFPRSTLYTKGQLGKNYSSAVLRLNREEYGTGFIIDLQEGYILTAGHVVRCNGAECDDYPIIASSQFFDDEIELELVRDLGGKSGSHKDVALLKVKDSDDLETLKMYCTSLDVSLEKPRNDDIHYTYSYSRGQPDIIPKETRLRRNSDFSGIKDLYNFSSIPRTESGDSGSPVITVEGWCDGIIVAKRSKDAYYVHMYYIREIFDGISMNKRLGKINQEVLDNEITNKSLRNWLTRKVRPIYNLSNLELYVWVNTIHKNKDKYLGVKLIDCPISTALTVRGLDYARRFLVSFYSKDQAARQYQKDAAFHGSFNEYEKAKTSLKMSVEKYEQSMISYTEENGAIIGSIQKNSGLNRELIEYALPEAWEVERHGRSNSNYFSALLKDYSLVLLELAKLEEDDEVSFDFLRRGYIASVMSASAAERDLNGFKANAFGLSGDFLYEFGAYGAASEAYALSYANGNQSKWLKGNYDEALVRGIGSESFPQVFQVKKAWLANPLSPKVNSEKPLEIFALVAKELKELSVGDIKTKKGGTKPPNP